MTKITKTIEEKRAKTAAGVRAFRARQSKKIKRLGYTSEQDLITRVLNNDLTEKHIAFIRQGNALEPAQAEKAGTK